MHFLLSFSLFLLASSLFFYLILDYFLLDSFLPSPSFPSPSWFQSSQGFSRKATVTSIIHWFAKGKWWGRNGGRCGGRGGGSGGGAWWMAHGSRVGIGMWLMWWCWWGGRWWWWPKRGNVLKGMAGGSCRWGGQGEWSFITRTHRNVPQPLGWWWWWWWWWWWGCKDALGRFRR